MLEINNTTKQKINLKKTREIAAKFLRVYKKVNREISLAIVADAKMKSLNFSYRGINKPTDVLSFSGGEETKFLGEIVINISEARRASKYQAMLEELGIKLKRGQADYIFYFLFVHGLLHLSGYDDKTEEGRREMLKRGKKFLAEIA